MHDVSFSTTLRAVTIFGALDVAVAAFGFGPSTAVSVGMGAVLALGNLWLLARIVGPLVEAATGHQVGASYGLLAAMKLFALFGGMWLLMSRGWASPLALVAGYGALPLGIVTASLFATRS